MYNPKDGGLFIAYINEEAVASPVSEDSASWNVKLKECT